jgi:hypothetical protein
MTVSNTIDVIVLVFVSLALLLTFVIFVQLIRSQRHERRLKNKKTTP